MKAIDIQVGIPEFPSIFEENSQLVGYTSECKHQFQCGHLKSLCTNPDTPIKYCLWGWYSAGLMPDALCEWYVNNPYWANISTNYFVNRNGLVKRMIEAKLCPDVSETSIGTDNVGDYLFKPLNIFLINSPKDINADQITDKWPWLKIGANKPIQRIEYTEDWDSLRIELANMLDQIPGLGYVPSIILVWDETQPEFVDKVGNFIKDHESIQTVNIATRLSHAQLIQRNEVVNFTHLNNDIWAYHMKDIFKGRVIMCIAGGPSLTNQIELIKENRSKFIIFAVTTVAHVLFANGIKPDLIGTIDMKPDNKVYIQSIKSEDVQSTHLLYEIDASSEVVDSYVGPRIMLCADLQLSPIPGALVSYIQHDGSIIHKSGTIANLLYQFAKFCGASEIVLAGYDFCYPSGSSHVEGADLNTGIEIIDGDGAKFIRQINFSEKNQALCAAKGIKLVDGSSTQVDQAIEVMSNNGNLSYTTKTFYTYLLEMKARIETEPIIRTIDVSDVGALKEGAEYIPLIDYVNTITVTEDIDIYGLIESRRKPVLGSSAKKSYFKNLLRGNNANNIKENHEAKLTYLIRQYNQFPELKHDNITSKLTTMINARATEDLNLAMKKNVERIIK